MCFRTIEATGPTNTRFFRVAVYFRGNRLAHGTGNSIQDAEMAAATAALQKNQSKYEYYNYLLVT